MNLNLDRPQLVRIVRMRLIKRGVPPAVIEAHLSVIRNLQATEVPWRSIEREESATRVGPTKVPTLFIWGDQDETVGRAAVEGTGEFIVTPHQFAALSGVGHCAAGQVPEHVNALLLAHLARHPVSVP